MAVLIEGISVVIRRSAIDGHIHGGWSAFIAQLPPATLCDDAEIAGVGFRDSDDLGSFLRGLIAAGLQFVADGVATDLAVVDQLTGITTPCPWLEFGHIRLDDARPADEQMDEQIEVAACRLAGTAHNELVLPRDWQYAGSLTEKYGLGSIR